MATRSTKLVRLVPADDANLHQLAYAQLRHAIMAGAFRPGEALTMRGIAAALGTSIMPARDAMLRLIGEHALEKAGRGVRVPVLDARRAGDVLLFRVALEGEAASLAAIRATPAQIREIERAAARTEKARDGGRLDRFLAANQEFHFAIYRAAHSELLVAMVETLWLQIGPHLAAVASRIAGDLGGVDLTFHVELVRALKRRDADAARAALRADLVAPSELYDIAEDGAPAEGLARAIA